MQGNLIYIIKGVNFRPPLWNLSHVLASRCSLMGDFIKMTGVMCRFWWIGCMHMSWRTDQKTETIVKKNYSWVKLMWKFDINPRWRRCVSCLLKGRGYISLSLWEKYIISRACEAYFEFRITVKIILAEYFFCNSLLYCINYNVSRLKDHRHPVTSTRTFYDGTSQHMQFLGV